MGLLTQWGIVKNNLVSVPFGTKINGWGLYGDNHVQKLLTFKKPFTSSNYIFIADGVNTNVLYGNKQPSNIVADVIEGSYEGDYTYYYFHPESGFYAAGY